MSNMGIPVENGLLAPHRSTNGAHMSTSIVVWIVIAVVAVALIAALVIGLSRARRQRRQRQAEEIREQARLETAKLERREAFAQETAAKARAAQAEAEVKAAEAARLQEQAAKHRAKRQHRASNSKNSGIALTASIRKSRRKRVTLRIGPPKAVMRRGAKRRTNRPPTRRPSGTMQLCSRITTATPETIAEGDVDRDGPPPQRAIPVFRGGLWLLDEHWRASCSPVYNMR